MIFKVNSKLKGSLLLNSLKNPLIANAIVFIDENILNALDVKSAINREILIPEKPNEYGKFKKHNVKMVITNKTDRILVMGEISLGPRESTLIDEKTVNHDHIRFAFAEKLIDIKTNKVSIVLPESQSPSITNNDQNTQTEETQTEETQIEETVNEIEATATIWDFTEQKMKEAQKTPKTAELVDVDEDNKKEEEESKIDFIDREEKKKIIKKKIAKKKNRKKITKKKNVKSKTKEKVFKTKKLKAVGKVRPEIKSEEIIIEELDSRGNPIKKPSDVLSDLITELNQSQKIDFIDKE